MMKMYVRDMAAEWGYTYKKFNPTGRWKVRIVDDYVELYLEHKGWLFKKWYNEDDVILQNEETFINECQDIIA